MVGPCRWEIHASELAPDLTSSIDGWIDTSDGTVRGGFAIAISGIGGLCETTIAWSEVD
jgi:hypothetical protein